MGDDVIGCDVMSFSGCHVILRLFLGLCFLELCFFHNDLMDDVMSMMS